MLRRALWRLLLIVTVSLVGLTPAPSAAAPAALQDACPEPNDEFQAACFLSGAAPVPGTLGAPEDVDAFRFESLDFNAIARISMTDAPFPYRLVLTDWDGKEMARSEPTEGRELIEMQLSAPGSYYVFVYASTSQVSSQPYYLAVQMLYATPNAPRVLYRQDFREGGSRLPAPGQGVQLAGVGGKLAITFTQAGAEGRSIWAPWIPVTRADDFTMAFDTRSRGGSRIFHVMSFANTDAWNYFQLAIGDHCGCVFFQQRINRAWTDLLPAERHRPVNIEGAVNRNVFRYINGEAILNVNGEEIFRTGDLLRIGGPIYLTSYSIGEPGTLNIDNVLVIAPPQ
jgi:hypothetical protein